MWPADDGAFSRPTFKAREKRPGDEVEVSHNLEGSDKASKISAIENPDGGWEWAPPHPILWWYSPPVRIFIKYNYEKY